MTDIQETACVRELARQVAEIALSPEMAVKRRRWQDAYMLRQPDRVPVWCRMGPCRRELLPEDDLQCTSPFRRSVERALRTILLCHGFGDDAVFNPYWSVPAAVECEGESVWGVPIRRTPAPTAGGAWAYDPPIKSEGDLDALRAPSWRHDQVKTDRRLQQYAELLGDVLPVRVNCQLPLQPGLGNYAGELLGMGGLLLNLALRPEMMHRLMRFLRDAVLAAMDAVEAFGILTENNDEQIHLSETLKTSPDSVPVKVGDLWGRTESQQFGEVSPAMWEEFCLRCQRPILDRFRHVSYGCCEDLTAKIDAVTTIPNLRIFVNSPWTDLRVSADRCRGRHCIVWRQKATDVIFAPDLAQQRRHLEWGLRLTQGCNRVIALQEIATVNGNPGRLQEWVAAAVAASERWS